MIYGDGRCAVCDRSIPEGRLMCRTHWFKVSSTLRRQVLFYFDLWSANACTLGQLREVQDLAVVQAGGEPRSSP